MKIKKCSVFAHLQYTSGFFIDFAGKRFFVLFLREDLCFIPTAATDNQYLDL